MDGFLAPGKRARRTMSSSMQVTLEIVELFEGTSNACFISRAPFERRDMDFVQDPLGPVGGAIGTRALTSIVCTTWSWGLFPIHPPGFSPRSRSSMERSHACPPSPTRDSRTVPLSEPLTRNEGTCGRRTSRTQKEALEKRVEVAAGQKDDLLGVFAEISGEGGEALGWLCQQRAARDYGGPAAT